METEVDDARVCSVCNKKTNEENPIITQVDDTLGGDYELISQITKKIIGLP